MTKSFEQIRAPSPQRKGRTGGMWGLFDTLGKSGILTKSLLFDPWHRGMHNIILFSFSKDPKMTHCTILFAAVAVTLAGVLVEGQAHGQTDVQKKLLSEIDKLLAKRQPTNTRMTLGLVKDVIQLAKSHGQKAADANDRDGYYRCYVAATDSLSASSSKQQNLSKPVEVAMRQLSEALKWSKQRDEVDLKISTIEYAFDRVLLDWEFKSSYIRQLISLGDKYFHKTQYLEASTCFRDAEKLLEEIALANNEDVDFNCRLAPLALGHALFALKSFKKASQAQQRGLGYVPNWPTYHDKIDRRGFHSDPADYDRILKELETTAATSPKNVDVQFLLGYEYFMTGRKSKAAAQFEKVKRLSPNHTGAKLYMR